MDTEDEAEVKISKMELKTTNGRFRAGATIAGKLDILVLIAHI